MTARNMLLATGRWLVNSLDNPGLRLVALWCAALAFVWSTPAGDALDMALARRTEFLVRELLDREPRLDPRIKLIVLDDRSFYRIGEPTLADWSRLVAALAAFEPRAIFIDKLFSVVTAPEEEVQVFRETLAKSPPVYAGVFMAPHRIEEGPAFLDAHFHPRNVRMAADLDASVPWIAGNDDEFAFGPSLRIVDAFAGVGHIAHSENGYFSAARRARGLRAVPTLGLLAGNDVFLGREGLAVDGKPVPLDERGRILINLPSRAAFELRHPFFKPLLPFIEAVRRGRPLPQGLIERGDVVFIVPGFATGSSDFVVTPFGNVPGGYTHVAVVNSVLTGAWLTPVGAAVPVLVGAGVVGMLAALLLPPWAGLLAIVLGSIGFFAAGMHAFVSFGLVLPWLGATFAFLGSGFLIFFERARSLEKKAQRVSHALEGLVSPALLRTLLRTPDALSFEAVSVDVSVMFVDVSDFSVTTRGLAPGLVFERLKAELAVLSRHVVEHGGIIDKTLGDGLLCFFGYSYDRKASARNHARQAIECALAMQRDSATRIVAARGAGELSAIFPLRIGINSGLVHLGNVGDHNRIDLTVIGNAVNLAKRYEDACENMRILIGSATRERLLDGFELPLLRRYMMPKHHIDLIEAYEINPLANWPQLDGQVRWAMRGLTGRERRAERWEIPRTLTVHVRMGRQYEFQGFLRDFSSTGLLVECGVYLSRKVELPVVFHCEDPALRSELMEHEILPIMAVVRWGMAQGDAFLHGLEILNLNSSQRDLFVEIMLRQLGMKVPVDPVADELAK